MMPMTVQDVMTREVVVVGRQAGVRDVVGLLRTHHVSALPVVDEDGRVVGVVSESDLYLRQVRPPHHGLAALLPHHQRRLDRRKASGVTVEKLMSAPPVTIQADWPLAEAARRMYQHGVRRLPVVDDAGVPVGMVTRGDLLKAYLRVDQDIRQEIMRQAVPRVLERAVETVQVDVHDGVVELDGWVTRRSQALALIARAGATDGVVAVHSNLAYDVNDTRDWASRDPAARSRPPARRSKRAVAGAALRPGRAAARQWRVARRRSRRLRGIVEGARYRLARRGPDALAGDDIVADRVRSALGPVSKRLDVPRAHVMVTDRLHVGLLPRQGRPSEGRLRRRPPSKPLGELLEAAVRAGAAAEQAPTAVRAVVEAFAACLPTCERRRLYAGLLADLRHLAMPRHRCRRADQPSDLLNCVAEVSGVGDLARAERLTVAVLSALSSVLPPADPVRIQRALPAALRPLWQLARQRPAGARRRIWRQVRHGGWQRTLTLFGSNPTPAQEGDRHAAQIAEVMTTTVARVAPQTPLAQVTKLLRERGVTAVPVVDEQDHVLGVVSGMDLAAGAEPSHRPPAAMHRLARPGRARTARSLTAADRMSSPVITVTPGVSLRTAARLLQTHAIHHLPVIAGGKLVGMVTRRDLLAAFLRDDEQVRRQLAHTLEMTYHLTWDQVAVTVHNGVVRLEGRVERRSLAGELERLAAAVDGVTAVESKLAWDIDDTTAGAAAVHR